MNLALKLGIFCVYRFGFFKKKSKSCLTFVVYHFHKETCVWEDVYNLTKIEFAGEEQSEGVSLWAFGHLSEIPVVVYKCFIRNGRLSLTLSASVFFI